MLQEVHHMKKQQKKNIHLWAAESGTTETNFKEVGLNKNWPIK